MKVGKVLNFDNSREETFWKWGVRFSHFKGRAGLGMGSTEVSKQ